MVFAIFMLKVTLKNYYRFTNLDIDRFFFTCRKHRFIKLANLQIPKNLDLSKSNNRKKVIEPSIENHEKNIGCPPLFFIHIVRNAHKLRARRTLCKSVFFSNDINCWRKIRGLFWLKRPWSRRFGNLPTERISLKTIVNM
jgi:hypothetical protein